jgi:hypothetical protein
LIRSFDILQECRLSSYCHDASTVHFPSLREWILVTKAARSLSQQPQTVEVGGWVSDVRKKSLFFPAGAENCEQAVPLPY